MLHRGARGGTRGGRPPGDLAHALARRELEPESRLRPRGSVYLLQRAESSDFCCCCYDWWEIAGAFLDERDAVTALHLAALAHLDGADDAPSKLWWDRSVERLADFRLLAAPVVTGAALPADGPPMLCRRLTDAGLAFGPTDPAAPEAQRVARYRALRAVVLARTTAPSRMCVVLSQDPPRWGTTHWTQVQLALDEARLSATTTHYRAPELWTMRLQRPIEALCVDYEPVPLRGLAPGGALSAALARGRTLRCAADDHPDGLVLRALEIEVPAAAVAEHPEWAADGDRWQRMSP